MPDLRERFDYLAVIDNLTQPGFDSLADQARRRRTRRTALAGGGVAVLVVLAALAVPLLMKAPTGKPQPPAASGATEPGSEFDYRPGQLDFFDAQHGYLMLEGFSTSPNADTCVMAVRATSDGGKTWSDPRKMPCVPIGGGMRYGFRVVGPETLVQITGDADRSFLSRDGGKTWKEYAPAERTADAFPDGVTPSRGCADEPVCSNGDDLVWFDPATGDHLTLTNGPALTKLRTVARGTDGSVWVAGYATNGEYAVAVTRDSGRTWTTTPVGLTGKVTDGPSVSTYDGRTGYLMIANKATDAGGTTHKHSILRTADGGRTWQRVDTEPPARSFGLFQSVVTADGRLLVPGVKDNNLRWYVSTDGGTTFEPASDFPPIGFISNVPGLYHAGISDGVVAYYVSEDATHWRKLSFD